jgi:hypothetical protein
MIYLLAGYCLFLAALMIIAGVIVFGGKRFKGVGLTDTGKLRK